MPKISDVKIEKISEQILSYLYGVFPRLVFTVDVARELARDEEFVKRGAFSLIAGLAVHDKKAEDSKFEDFFSIIKRSR